MPLTSAQQTLLRTAVLADPTLSALPHTSDGADAIAAYYSQVDPATRKCWHHAAETEQALNAVTWTNFTPNDAPDTSLLWANRAMACQIKQINLQLLLQGRSTINANLQNTRAGLQDALTAIPSGIAGANRNAGWPNDGLSGVPLALQRQALRIEWLLKGPGSGTVAAPFELGYTGSIGIIDVMLAMGW